MRPSPRLWTRLALTAALVVATSGAAFANTIAVPLGTGSVQCDATHPNTARFAGYCGAQVTFVAADTTAAFVQDNSLSNESTYRVRFNANLLRLPMVGSDSFDLFVVYDGADPAPPTVAGNAVIRVNVSVSGGLKQLVVYTRLNDGSYADTSAAPVRLIDGFRTIELEWAAGSPGFLNIWIDGFLCNGVDNAAAGSGAGACASLAGLVNSNVRGNYARWGAPANVNVSVAGTANLDDFASQRTGYIGPAIPFPNDTPTGNAAWREVQGIYETGLTSGCAVGSYCGLLNISRRQMSVFVIRAKYGATIVPPPAVGMFADVGSGSSNFQHFVEQIANDGIDTGGTAAGCTPGNFCPEVNMDRSTMATWLLKAEHGGGYVPPACTSATFADVPCSHPNAAFIYQLAAEGITLGCGGGNYCPTLKVSRSQMALFLQRTYKPPTGAAGITATERTIPRPQVGP
jgi:hypothetical protein